MKNYLPGEPHILPLLLTEIFPLCDLSLPVGNDDDWLVNAAYEKLFEELIPGFKAGEVPFVLAEVLELDREESQPRILVYSNRDKAGVDELLEEYFRVIERLSEDQWSISKTDALYTSSRIWCAEIGSAGCQVTDDKRKWVSSKKGTFPAGYAFADKVAEDEEVEQISVAFKRYVKELHSLHLKNYPFSYVMLIPIFLGSMYAEKKKKARTKLGAIFLHFATAKRIDDRKDLLRIYSRTLLFWHYYFTSEAIYSRQDVIERTAKTLEERITLFNKIKPSIDDIRYFLHAVQKPLAALEAEMDPVRAILFGENLTRFFISAGEPIPILDGKQEVTPKHDWGNGPVEVYKRLVAGLLLKAFGLEKELEGLASNLWEQVSALVNRKAHELSQPLYQALLNSLPHLSVTEPSDAQVEETFRIIKSWFSDAYKLGKAIPGMPVTMLGFAFDVWGCKFRQDGMDSKTFWVASEPPVMTIDALWILHEKHRLQAAEISVRKEEHRLETITSCEMRLTLEQSHREVSNKQANLARLRDSLESSLAIRAEHMGDMTKFLWVLSGGRKLNLKGTVFSWKKGNCEFSVDFKGRKGEKREMLVRWSGEINA
jgi:hypothetical protein